MYIVYVRNWWRMENGARVPHPRAHRHMLAKVETYDEARELCKAYNATHAPGKLSRKAEFTDARNY